MAFSYTPGSATSANRVRLLIGDTDSSATTQQRLEDEEIADLLAIAGSFRAAAAASADALAAKFARLATSKSMGQASLVWQRFEQLRQLAMDLRASVSLAAIPFAGGMSRSLKNTNAQNTDRITPTFVVGMLDNPSSKDTGTSGVTT